LLQLLKSQLPFTFRFEISTADAAKPVDLQGIPRIAQALIGKIVATLGRGWQATIFFSHIILYKKRHAYKFGQAIVSGEVP